jgi:hypothetical protein
MSFLHDSASPAREGYPRFAAGFALKILFRIAPGYITWWE